MHLGITYSMESLSHHLVGKRKTIELFLDYSFDFRDLDNKRVEEDYRNSGENL